MTKFNGSEGGEIALSQASDWTANYREKITDSSEVKAHFFGREILQKILDQPEAIGIRMYYALDDTGMKQLVLVGADKEGTDLIEGIIADKSTTCPPDCGSSGLSAG